VFSRIRDCLTGAIAQTDQWAVGDLAECLVEGQHWVNPAGKHADGGPDRGDVVQVVGIRKGLFINHYKGTALVFRAWAPRGYDARDFRKVLPVSKSIERRIRACVPRPVLVDA